MLVLPCGNFGEFSTHSLRQCCVVISQRYHRIASFFRLALTQISGTDIHRYFRKAVLDGRRVVMLLSSCLAVFRQNMKTEIDLLIGTGFF